MYSIVFTALGIVVVIFYILLLTDSGSRYIARFVGRHPLIAKSMNNIVVASQKLAQMGSVYSVAKSPKGSPKASENALHLTAAMNSLGSPVSPMVAIPRSSSSRVINTSKSMHSMNARSVVSLFSGRQSPVTRSPESDVAKGSSSDDVGKPTIVVTPNGGRRSMFTDSMEANPTEEVMEKKEKSTSFPDIAE
jgi:hypothetical protein